MTGPKDKSPYEVEKKHMEGVYQQLDLMRAVATDVVSKTTQYVSSGAFEDQDAFMAYGELSCAKSKKHEIEVLFQTIYEKPYFTHVEAKINDEDPNHYYLSDSDSLEEYIDIGPSNMIVPFKLDENRPISKALYHCYVSQDGKPTDYVVRLKHGESNQCIFTPSLICDVEISKRELLNARLVFSSESGEVIDADELLSQILDDNRNDPTLRNIIATLQQRQFEIIAADVNQNFIVQGCAGSGKSQCLLHRLFFLRDELSKGRWEKVLLITPTQLFRNYSADLVRRYNLSSIKNSSISELYFDLLYKYDLRFKNRQYMIRLSEEYLPDQYLNEIYSDTFISKIDKEIYCAIREYVTIACNALGINTPDNIDISVVSQLINQLEGVVEKHNLTDEMLLDDAEYQMKKDERDRLLLRTKEIDRELLKMDSEIEKVRTEMDKLYQLISDRDNTLQERDEWVKLREFRIASARDALAEAIQEVESTGTVVATIKYAKSLFKLKDLISGDSYQSDEEYLEFLNEYCEDAEVALKSFSKRNKPGVLHGKQNDKLADINLRRNSFAVQLVDLNNELSQCELWIRKRTEEIEGERTQRSLNKSELEKARYYLSRIETTVFEQEIWNVLLDIKKKYGVEHTFVEKIDETRRRETKILYKSDLLFYLKLYAELYPKVQLPDYKLFCIDEAQDLHKADFNLLKKLFPKAVFNIFGDIAQVLHKNCGISNWEKETGISTVYSMTRNYRNTAATVEFCNNRFGSDMQSIGKIKQEQIPKVLTNGSQLKNALDSPGVTVIVKDKECFEAFTSIIGDGNRCEYVDTNAEKPNSQIIPCYSVFAAKGLEFTNVIVFAKNMTVNQKVVACTRAMEGLNYYE